MSSVRQCDNCQYIFSENMDGWANMTGTRMVRNPETGKNQPQQVSIDHCPTCVEAETGPAGSPQAPTVNERRTAIAKAPEVTPGNVVAE